MWQFSIATVLLVAMATSTTASWKWDENASENTTATASTVTSSSSTISTSTTISQEDSRKPVEPRTDTPTSQEETEDALLQEELDSPANDTEPRFIGGLKKKLCSVGLGINRGELYECKGTGLKKKVRIQRDTKDDKAEPSPRLIGLLGGLASGSGVDGVKSPAFVPSFGVNFGSLPTGGGYGPYGSPHGSNPLGLDIGPVSINPFVGFKVASLDGRPVFNPSLDLLVTPNAQGVHALQGIKEGIKHQLSPNKGYYPHGGGYPSRPYSGGHYPQAPYAGGYYPPSGYRPGGYHPGIGQHHGSGLYPQNGYQSSIYSPQSYLPHTPSYKPPYVPPKPTYTPPYVPPKPTYTPPYVPPKPVYTPSRPVYTPSRPVSSIHRPRPIADYSTQSHRPSHVSLSDSIYTPSRPSFTPSSIHHGEKPVEIHHHEHTHFHDHDHDHDHDNSHNSFGRPYNSNSFDPIFRGRSDNLDNGASSRPSLTSSLSSNSRPTNSFASSSLSSNSRPTNSFASSSLSSNSRPTNSFASSSLSSNSRPTNSFASSSFSSNSVPTNSFASSSLSSNSRPTNSFASSPLSSNSRPISSLTSSSFSSPSSSFVGAASNPAKSVFSTRSSDSKKTSSGSSFKFPDT